MQVGDLVRNSFNRQTGVILSEAEASGPHVVWRILVNGKVRKWQRFQMEVISERR